MDNKCNELQSQAWFTEMVEEFRDLVVEGEFGARWTLITTYHTLGEHLTANLDKFPKGIDPIKAVAKAIKKSSRLVYQCCQFVKKFPDINKLPDGKIITWRKIANELLPEHTKVKPTLDQRIKQFIEDYYPRARNKDFIREVIEEWETL